MSRPWAYSRLHSKPPFKIAEGANRRRKLVLTPDCSNYRKTRLVVIGSGLALAATADCRKAEGSIAGNGLLKELTKA
jgi:hypothetical protein